MSTRPFCGTESDIFYTQNAFLALAEASSSVYYLVVSEQYLVKALIEAFSIVRVPGTIFEPRFGVKLGSGHGFGGGFLATRFG